MDQQPTFRSKEAFKIVGVERYTGVGISAIQEAWEEFGKRIPEIKHKIEPVAIYGFEDYSHDFDLNVGAFTKFNYIAALEVDSFDDIPERMVGKEVPVCNCAVFRYQGPIAGISTFFRSIYDEWLPASGYQLDPNVNADFERRGDDRSSPSRTGRTAMPTKRSGCRWWGSNVACGHDNGRLPVSFLWTEISIPWREMRSN